MLCLLGVQVCLFGCLEPYVVNTRASLNMASPRSPSWLSHLHSRQTTSYAFSHCPHTLQPLSGGLVCVSAFLIQIGPPSWKELNSVENKIKNTNVVLNNFHCQSFKISVIPFYPALTKAMQEVGRVAFDIQQTEWCLLSQPLRQPREPTGLALIISRNRWSHWRWESKRSSHLPKVTSPISNTVEMEDTL